MVVGWVCVTDADRLIYVERRVAVVGAGSWGTVIASMIARKVTTVLWARSCKVSDAINDYHENPTYLPGLHLPKTLRATSSLAEVSEGASLVFIAVPSHGFRQVLVQLAPYVGKATVMISLSKGLEISSNLRMSEVIREILPDMSVGVLTGPNLAREIAQGQPAASVVASNDVSKAFEIQQLLHSDMFRVYTSTDVIGCEIAGAVKNVIAIAVGISDGLGFGENTRAVLMTRGLAELERLGLAVGGDMDTFKGLAGVGDLVATCTSSRSRNRTLGYELGQGRKLKELLSGTQSVAEGVETAAPLRGLAQINGVEMPIVEQVCRIIQGDSSPRQALVALMDRPEKPESESIYKNLQRSSNG